ncbi:hypothetical protein JCM10207_007525 [Rhodosporidiobolus poonsookiae]
MNSTALPIPAELRLLQQQRDDAALQLDRHKDLLARLNDIQRARARGNGRMEVPVDLGMGFMAEGVVEDTARVIVAAGVDDLFLDLPIERAGQFVEKRIAVLEKKQQSLKAPIARLTEEHASLAQTLQKALHSQAGAPAS